MPSLLSFARMLAVVLCLSFSAGIQADEIQDINQLFRKGDLNTALARANQFLAKNPRDAQVRFLKGLILADLGKSAEAIEVFTGITEDYPELPEPYNNLAVLYAAEGKYDAAKNALEMAIRTHPSYATAHENLGDLYARMASQAYDKALQIDNSNKTAQTKLALIKEMMAGKPAQNRTAAANSKPAATTSAPVASAQTAAPAAKPAPATAAAAELAATKTPDVVETVQAWAKAWSSKDVKAYLAHYSPDFTPTGMSRAAWMEQRRERISKPKRISVILRDIQVRRISPDRAEVRFRQYYQSDTLRSNSGKTLDLALTDGQWLIVRESGR
ncbi:MAG: tetratricopeptide repeat protein [Pseudomonadota bacterium]